jgi:hypothetical protein
MRNIVDQFSLNDWRSLPKDGVPVSNLTGEFLGSWIYGYQLRGLPFPSDYTDTAPYPYYDRWCDDWNVSTEGSTTDTARSLAAIGWLAARTTLSTQAWRYATASIVLPAGARQPNQPVTVTLQVADPNLAAARILWEVAAQAPAFGTESFSFTSGPTNGTYLIEAEAQWPDGRRAFARNTVTVSTAASPQLSAPQKLSGGGFAFTLAGSPSTAYWIQTSTDLMSWQTLATNTLPAGGSMQVTDPSGLGAGRKFYRAVKAQ